MTTSELNDSAISHQSGAQRTSWFRSWLARRQRRRIERRTLLSLSHLDDHLLQDIGIEPQDVYDALHSLDSAALFDVNRGRF